MTTLGFETRSSGNLFEELNKIDVSGHTEKKKSGKDEITYLSWAWAWGEFKKRCPTATYEIKRFENNEPYFYDEKLGYMVFTSVTVDNLTYEMWLPVMDSSNKAMKKEQYTYSVKEYFNGKATGKTIEKTVEPATMFDINKTIMRCLVKNLAMFGLGLYIYAGEDLPEGVEDASKDGKKEFEKMVTADKRAFNKAVKDGAQQAPEKRPLSERIELSFAWLKNITQAEFDKNSARRDSVHDVRDLCLASPDADTRAIGEELKKLIEVFEPPLDDNANI